MEIDIPIIVTGFITLVILVVIMVVLGMNIVLGYMANKRKYEERTRDRKSSHNDDS